MSRLEIEARFFLFTSLGRIVHAEHFCLEDFNREQMVTNLLTHYPFERWYEMQILTRVQVNTWLEQALEILTSNPDASNDRSK